jgi:hypothetical protein
MCFFHTKQAIMKTKKYSRENETEILNDIDQLQHCQSKEVFEAFYQKIGE